MDGEHGRVFPPGPDAQPRIRELSHLRIRGESNGASYATVSALKPLPFSTTNPAHPYPMKTSLLFSFAAFLLVSCDAKVTVPGGSTTVVNPPAEKKVEHNTTVVTPPAEKKVENNTTIVNPPAEKK